MKKLIWILVLALTLSGCSLAVGSWGNDGLPLEDELVGMLVTLSIQQEDGTITDVWDENAAGMTPIHLFENRGKRLYAERYEKDGMPSFRFPEGCGLECYGFYVFPEDGEAYMDNVVSPELSDVLRTSHVGETGSTHNTEVTLHAKEGTKTVAYLNPVYYTAKGEVYALGNAPMGYDLATMDNCTASITQETSIRRGEGTVNGGTVSLGCKVEMPPVEYWIWERDAEGELVHKTSFLPQTLPEIYKPVPEAAYFELNWNLGGLIGREVYSKGVDTVMELLEPGRYDLLIVRYAQIEWEG